MCRPVSFFFFNDTATTEIYTLSLHDALPISHLERVPAAAAAAPRPGHGGTRHRASPGAAPSRPRRPARTAAAAHRSEEHTSELQSHLNLVCRLLLLKKNKRTHTVRRDAHGCV